MVAIGLLPLLSALPGVATTAIDGLTGLVKAGKRLVAAWQATEPLPPGAPTMRDLEHQRDQMRAATSRGTVQGPPLPVTNGRTLASIETPAPASARSVPKG